MSVPGELQDEAPTTKLVYKCLDELDEPVSQQTIADEAGIHVRQARSALAVLDQKDLLREEPDLSDLRRKRYEIPPDV